MADVNVKNQTSQKEGKALEKRTERGLSRRGWEPFSWSLMPSDFFRSDFFSSNPFTWMRRVHDEMDRTFARLLGRQSDGESGFWYPAIEVAERDGQLKVRAELPGMKPEDVKVEVTDNALIIQGERKYEHEDKERGVYRSERQYGQFYREVPLPEGANADQAKASFKDGVLEVLLPVPEAKSNRRTIAIETGSSSSANSAAQK